MLCRLCCLCASNTKETIIIKEKQKKYEKGRAVQSTEKKWNKNEIKCNVLNYVRHHELNVKCTIILREA